MAEKQTEEPTVEEPTPKEPKPEDMAKDLLAKLESLGIDTPERIDGIATASRESGNIARQMGEIRRQNAELQEALKNQIQTQSTDTEYGESVDLGALIDQRLENFVGKLNKKQTEAQQRYYGELAAIESDDDYGLVKDIFEKHITSPKVQGLIAAGQTTAGSEYQKLVNTVMRESLKQSKDIIIGLTSKGVTPPHVESGNTQSIALPTEEDEMTTKVKRMTDRTNWQGTDQDILKLVKTLLPSDSTIFK